MKKKTLDKLLKNGVLSKEEYDSFFTTMSENERGEMIGIAPTGNVSHKYHLEGDLLQGDLIEFLKTKVDPPYEAEEMDEVFHKYGMMVCGIGDRWYWFTNDNITEQALKNGRKPIEEATELEIWKMIAICERYWHISYERWYEERKGK